MSQTKFDSLEFASKILFYTFTCDDFNDTHDVYMVWQFKRVGRNKMKWIKER